MGLVFFCACERGANKVLLHNMLSQMSTAEQPFVHTQLISKPASADKACYR